MARTPRDPILNALAKEAAELDFPYVEPSNMNRGILVFPNGKGLYTFLRVGGHTFFLGVFPPSRLSAGQLYADAARAWFSPYLRRRPSVESPDALYNHGAENAAKLLTEVDGLMHLFQRIEQHLNKEHTEGRPGLLLREIAEKQSAETRLLQRSPSRLAAKRIDILEATVTSLQNEVGLMRSELSTAQSNLAKQVGELNAFLTRESRSQTECLHALDAFMRDLKPALLVAASNKAALDLANTLQTLATLPFNAKGLIHRRQLAEALGASSAQLEALFPALPLDGGEDYTKEEA